MKKLLIIILYLSMSVAANAQYPDKYFFNNLIIHGYAEIKDGLVVDTIFIGEDTITSGGGGTPSGITGDLQLNNGGVFGSANDLTTGFNINYLDSVFRIGDIGDINYLEYRGKWGGQLPYFQSYGEKNVAYHDLYSSPNGGWMENYNTSGDGAGIWSQPSSGEANLFVDNSDGYNQLNLDYKGVYISDVTNATVWTDDYLITKGFADTAYTYVLIDDVLIDVETTDYNSWNKSDYVGNFGWGMSVSYDGEYIASGFYNRNIILSDDYGIDFNLTGNANNMYKISMSGSGQYMLASYTLGTSGLWKSSDYGQTWADVASSYYVDLNVSRNGQVQYYSDINIGDNKIYRSNDYGANWTLLTNPFGSTKQVKHIKCDPTGQYVTIASRNSSPALPTYYSIDYGVTWTTSNLSFLALTSLTATPDMSYLVITTDDGSGASYVSVDQGATWVALNIPVDYWNYVGISDDGKNMILSTWNTTDIIYSTDYGVTWNTSNYSPSNSSYYMEEFEVTNDYILAKHDYDSAFYSIDDGANWIKLDFDDEVNRIEKSGDNKIFYAGTETGIYILNSIVTNTIATERIAYDDNTFSKFTDSTLVTSNYVKNSIDELTGSNGVIIRDRDIYLDSTLLISSTFGTGDWNLTNAATTAWKALAVSADGSYQTMADDDYIYYSTDYGINWTQSNSSQGSYFSIDMSDDGSKQTAVKFDGNVYYSTDYGINWIQSNAPSTTWRAIGMSGDGQYQSIINNVYTSYSTDYGINWVQSNAPSKQWRDIAVSADGSIQVAVVDDEYIYYSTDYGINWVQSNSFAKAWNSVDMSADGRRLTASIYNGEIYYSIDYGINWILSNAPTAPWIAVSVSADGERQLATQTVAGLLYYSNDYGVNWTENGSANNLNGVAMSADGEYQTGTSSSGTYYSRIPDSRFTDRITYSNYLTLNYNDSTLIPKKYVDDAIANAKGIIQVIQTQVLFSNITQTTIITLPTDAVVTDIYIDVVTEFNGTGTDLLDIGVTADPNKYTDAPWGSVDLSIVEWSVHTGNGGSDPRPDRMTTDTDITFIYIDQNSDASTGEAKILIHYIIF